MGEWLPHLSWWRESFKMRMGCGWAAAGTGGEAADGEGGKWQGIGARGGEKRRAARGR